MSEKVFENAIILSGKELEAIHGYLKIEEGIITEIEQGEPEESGVDMEKAFIIPPFVNAHTHLGDSVKKDIYEGKSQPDVVAPEGEKFKALEQSSSSEKIRAIRDSLYDMKESGVVAHCDFREEGIEGVKLLNEAKIEGMRTIILSRPSSDSSVEGILERSHGVGVPSLDSIESEDLRVLSNLVKKSGKILSFHVSETKVAHEKSIQDDERTEIERVLDFDPSFLIHGTWASGEDLKMLSQLKVPLVMCPRANCLFSDGIPPIKKAIEKGVDIWLGTDNVTACSPIVLEELSFSWKLLRLQSDESGRSEAKELLKAATVNPLEGLSLNCGPLDEGNDAAFIVVSRGRNLRNCISPHIAIVNRARVDNVDMVYLPKSYKRDQ